MLSTVNLGLLEPTHDMGFYGNLMPKEEPIDQPEISQNNDNINVQLVNNEQNIKDDNEPRAKPKQTCKVCGKLLSSLSSYYVHMKLHSGNKPYQCTVCDAAFCRKPYLEVHMRTHTGEKPFECNQCLKRFTQKSSLNTHKRVHTGERPYSCDICEKRFAVKSYVTAHRWSHVGAHPLSCQDCQKTFSSKHQFAMHIRTHSRGRNHECSVCGRTFVRDSYLIRHLNKAHPEQENSSHTGIHFIDSAIGISQVPAIMSPVNEISNEK